MPALLPASTDGILNSYAEGILGKYSAEFADGGSDGDDSELAEALQRVREQLHSTQSSAAVCLICLETMHNDDAVWHCSQGCCCVLHLLCIQAWSRQQLSTAAYTAAADPARVNPADQAKASWGCPKCRTAYTPSEVPLEYHCFCGKQKDPPVDPWLAPHTCGDMCGKQLALGCGHTCVLLCHPGPCPPCPRQVMSACHCGKVNKPVRCSQANFSCGKLCGSRLPCGHRCPHKCHPGRCPDCALTARVSCHCGAETQTLPCSQRDFHCNRGCGKMLSCGRHRCEKVCHEGPCGGCPMEGPRLCPCGKVEYKALACDEEALPCGGTCNKLLPCGRHSCAERCHHGPCTPICRAMLDKHCVCGKTHKVVQCHEMLRCEKKCSNMKGCGRHQCRRRCCDGECPPCDQPCGRRLRCGNHKCPAPCHSGPCLPCPLTSTVACACGGTRYSLPCGSEAKAVPPQCRHVCPVPVTCRHAETRPPHRCHWGPCPPCSHFCGTPHSCGHACSSPSCHDRPPPSIPAFPHPLPPVSVTFTPTKPVQHETSRTESRTPAVQAAVAVQESKEGFLTDCPPCQAPVPTACLGGHTIKPLPCCSAAPFSCGGQCGQPLACGNHTCSKPCHDLTAELGSNQGTDDGTAGEPCETCLQPCQRDQPCGHACPLRCHPQPCPPCQEAHEQGCHCGRSLVPVLCHQLQQASAAETAQLLCCGKPCHKALPHCPHVCQATCHPGPCPAASGAACQEEVTVRCLCRRHKAKMPCNEVQRKLKTREGLEGYTDATPLRLLPCHQTCKAAKGSKQEAEDAEKLAASEVSSPSPAEPSRSSTSPHTMASGDKGPRRRNRSERAALQQQQELVELLDAKRKRRWAILWRAVQAVSAFGFVYAAFVVFYGML